jgi:hypothetical protein
MTASDPVRMQPNRRQGYAAKLDRVSDETNEKGRQNAAPSSHTMF